MPADVFVALLNDSSLAMTGQLRMETFHGNSKWFFVFFYVKLNAAVDFPRTGKRRSEKLNVN